MIVFILLGLFKRICVIAYQIQEYEYGRAGQNFSWCL